MRILAILILVPLLDGYAFGQDNRSSSKSSSDNPGPCVAEAKWSNTSGNLAYSKQAALPVSVTLLAHVRREAIVRTRKSELLQLT